MHLNLSQYFTMIRTLSIIFLFVLFLAACDKGKFQTKPTLELKSMSGNVVPVDGQLLLEFDYTDKEGDVDNSIFVKKVRLNKQQVPTIRDEFDLPVPEFPQNTQGTIQVLMDNAGFLASAINPPNDPVSGKPQPDTLLLKFVLKDRAGNTSDTVTTGQVIVLRN